MPFVTHRRFQLVCLLAILSFPGALNAAGVAPDARCYFPNSRFAEDYVPCNSTGTNSPCCHKHDYCLANGLCYGGSTGVNYRGGCTDSGWTSDECPQRCLQTGQTNTWWNIISCGDGKQACVGSWGGKNDCSGLKEVFSWNATDILPVVAMASNFGTRSTVTATATLLPGQTLSPTAASALQSGDSPQVQNSKTKNRMLGIGLGLGIGVPLTILSVALATLFFSERRKRKALEISSANVNGWATYGYGQGTDKQSSIPGIYGGEMEGTKLSSSDAVGRPVHEASTGNRRPELDAPVRNELG